MLKLEMFVCLFSVITEEQLVVSERLALPSALHAATSDGRRSSHRGHKEVVLSLFLGIWGEN